MRKIIRNAIQCKHCGDTIESVNVHDYVTCSCGACSVDGGHDYLRRCYRTSPEEDFVELSKYEETDSGEDQLPQADGLKYNSETEAAMKEAIKLSKDPNTKKYATFAEAVKNMKELITFDMFLKAFEHDDIFPVDETSFYFSDNPNETDHCLGCLREYEKPYWVGYCDVPDGCEYATASEMLEAKIFDGKSIKDRWDSVVLCSIGGIPVEDWLDQYGVKLI